MIKNKEQRTKSKEQKFAFLIPHFLLSLLFFLCYLFFGFSLSAQPLSLDDTLIALGENGTAEFLWDPMFASGRIIAGGYEASFSSGGTGETGAVLMDRREVLNLPLPYLEMGNILFPETFVTQVKNTFTRYAEEDKSRLKIGAIIIDPGHGGRDGGASIWEYTVNGEIYNPLEKDINLKVSRHLHALLMAFYPDKQVILTRGEDTAISKEDRVEMANSVSLAPNEEAIYISVHANSSLNRSARGYEIWYLSPNYRRELIDRSTYEDAEEIFSIRNSMLEEGITRESILLANSILRGLDETVGDKLPSRGLMTGDYFVIKNARMPSVLVELGFLSNETDALLMRDDAYLIKLSQALYKGIIDFVSLFERSGGFTALR